ncbi:DNA-binding transcriptional repressor PuuR [Corynebacterium ciconiae DSM 44920]|nr:DNA-binding transcriptional repressor PuuR [Corynebacterium ciconiae DSM 44920]
MGTDPVIVTPLTYYVSMGKTYVGSRLRQLRRERDLSQASLADTLGLSASYVNQIEHDVRPLTVSVLSKITEAFGIDATFFSREDDSRLLAEVKDVIADKELVSQPVDLAELSEVVADHPAVAKTIVDMHRRYRSIRDKLSLLTDHRSHADEINDQPGDVLDMPHEQVRDFIHANNNYFHSLDTAAEKLHHTLGLSLNTSPSILAALHRYVTETHGVTVVPTTASSTLHRFDPSTSTLEISTLISPGQQAFRIASELAYLEIGPELHQLVDEAEFTTHESTLLALRGLASYYAAALLLPYTEFHERVEKSRYDLEYLASYTGLGFETICHRVSTLQRPGLRGIPFTFIRVDRAGNMSKRLSAAGFHFTHSGGTCPLWNVYEAFSSPGHLQRQFASMPDGRTYVWVARTVSHRYGTFEQRGKEFAIGLGCEARHAGRMVYFDSMPVSTPAAAVPIGPGCRVCARTDCAQRAFPAIQGITRVDAHSSSLAAY